MRYKVEIKLKTGIVNAYVNNLKNIEYYEQKYSPYEGITITRIPTEEEKVKEKQLVKYHPKNKCWSEINK